MARPSIEALRRVPLFSDLDSKELEGMADTLRERTFAAGDTVTMEGAGGAGFFVVDQGEADVMVDGQKRGTIRAGDHFGEIALLTGHERTATIVASTELRCYGMTPWDFRPFFESNPTIAWKLLQSLAQKLS